ncbi:MAG: ribonuclease catalytic domain-containing protein [Desulfobaccales bacterium]
MEPGDLVEFFEDKAILVGVVLDLKGDRLQVVTATNRELTLAPKRVLHACPSGKAGSLSRQQWLNLLQDTLQRREALQQGINLTEIWEILVEEGKAASAAEMADLWFGSATPDQVAAMGRALLADRLLFKHKDGLWLPNPPDVVAALQDKARREEEARRDLEEAAHWLRTAWEGGDIPAPAPRQRLVELLKSVAVWGQDSPDYPLVKSYLDKAKITGDNAPFKLLVRLKVFSEDENLDLYRQETPLAFSPEALALALHLKSEPAPDPCAAIRADLTDLKCFTIDGERTRDLDDALSLEILPTGYRLGIHIADVSSLVAGGSVLDREAQERGTSIYLPETRLPMLPEDISEDTLSLVADKERRALSFLVTLDRDAEVQDWVIKPSLIRVRRRLSYSDADQLLEDKNDVLGILARLTGRLKARRLAQGGYELKLPEVWVSFDPQGRVLVTLEDQETPSHQLVSEAMVLANWLAASFLVERGAPAIYRAQPEPREPIDRQAKKTLFELWQDRRKLSRVVMDLKPQPHWGLCLPYYTFATSPIRRYLDLVIHRQILSLLAGGPPFYGSEELERLAQVIDPAMRRAGLLKNLRLRYWLLKHLAGRVGQKLEALVVEVVNHRCRLLLPDLLMEVPFTAPASLRLQAGDLVRVRLDKVLPREDQVKLSLA